MKGEIKMDLIGYKRIEDMVNLAVVAREHVLLVGPPGTAKSLFAHQMFKQYIAKTFFVQLSKFSDESVLFGPLNIEALKKGWYEFVYRETLLDAELAFIDELFDASDVLLRSVLGVLNERIFSRGSFSVSCPLVTCIATANYTRNNEVTEAVTDRFLFQFHTPVLSRDQRANLYNGHCYESFTSASKPIPVITDVDVHIPEEVINTLLALADDLKLSPRRERKIARMLKIYAVLQGKTAVDVNDLMIVSHLLPLEKQNKDIINRLTEIVKIFTEERVQKEQILSVKWDADGEPTLAKAKAIIAAVNKLSRLEACNDSILQLRNAHINKAKNDHQKCLQNLGII